MILVNRWLRVLPAATCSSATFTTCSTKTTRSGLLVNKNSTSDNRVQHRYIHISNVCHKKDYYSVLGVDKKADQKAVKKAYFNMAKKYHPDVNKTKEAQAKFQEITEAYEVLSDPTKRQEYDTFGSNPSAGMGGARGGGGQWNYHTTQDVNEIFRKAFGFGAGGIDWNSFSDNAFGHSAAQEIVLDLSFEEAVRGATKTVNMNVVEDCPKCKGTQVEPGYKKVPCPYCNGTGMQTQKMQGGFFYQMACGRCQGSGHFNKNPCQDCEGHGQTVQRRQVTLNVPAGTNDKDRVRFQVGGSHVYALFNVAPSLKFTRVGDDLYCDVEITIAQAILGGTVKVPGINEDTYVHIVPGTSSHTKLRLSGKGVKRLRGHGTGDQYINVRITVPKYLSDHQRELMKLWAVTDKPRTGTVKGVEESKEKKEEAKEEEKATGGEKKEKKRENPGKTTTEPPEANKEAKAHS